MVTQLEKLVDSCLLVEYFLSIAVSGDQKVLSNIGILGKIVFGNSAGK
jgi:hypothetical protein